MIVTDNVREREKSQENAANLLESFLFIMKFVLASTTAQNELLFFALLPFFAAFLIGRYWIIYFVFRLGIV